MHWIYIRSLEKVAMKRFTLKKIRAITQRRDRRIEGTKQESHYILWERHMVSRLPGRRTSKTRLVLEDFRKVPGAPRTRV